jgi:hypothetical protein
MTMVLQPLSSVRKRENVERWLTKDVDTDDDDAEEKQEEEEEEEEEEKEEEE